MSASRKKPKRYDPHLEAILERLNVIPGIRAKAMFGGYGLYADEDFFAVVADALLYIKVDDSMIPDFIAYGMDYFHYAPNKGLKRYYQVPQAILDHPVAFQAWVRRSIAMVRAEKCE